MTGTIKIIVPFYETNHGVQCWTESNYSAPVAACREQLGRPENYCGTRTLAHLRGRESLRGEASL